MNEYLPNSLSDGAQAWAEWMVGMSWQVAVLASVVALAAFALRRQSARLRYALWAVVLVKLLLPPTLALPTGYGWWLRPAAVDRLAVDRLAVEHAASSSQTATKSTSAAPHAETGAAVVPQASTALSAATGIWPMLLFVAWCAFVLARVLMLAAGALRVRQWIARAHDVVEPRVVDCFDAARRRAGLTPGRGPSVDLRESDSCATPLVVGLWRPTILLPRTIMQQLDDSELEAVLVHELVHVRRRDAWFRLGQSLLETLYFFHPAVWWAGRELRALREDACDETTVALLSGRRKAYGSALVKTASGVGYEPPHLALAALDTRSTLKRRLLRVLDPQLPLERPSWIWSFCAVGLIAVIFVPAGNTTERPLQQDDQPPSLTQTPPNEIDGSPEQTINPDQPPPAFPTPAPPASASPAPATTAAAASTSEQQAWKQLESPEALVRAEGYAWLKEFGTAASLERLEQRYLQSSGIEEGRAKEALDAIWSRIRARAAKSPALREPNRVFESP